MQIIKKPSPNFYPRLGHKPELIVVHCTEGNFPSDMGWLCNPQSQVSAHYVISPKGEIFSLVDESLGAWHAGSGKTSTIELKKDSFGKVISPNYYSIGIEVSLKPPATMPVAQKQALEWLTNDIANRNGIPKDRKHIVGHKEIVSTKTCPGTISVDELVKSINTEVKPVDKESIKKQIIELLGKL